jgi:glycosyltransferase involved in cell wall biosynthesis
MSLYLLNHTFAWWGKHSGFEPLAEGLRSSGCPNTVIRPRSGFAARAIGKSYSIWRRYPHRNQAMAAAECEFLLSMRFSQGSGHVLFLEDHLRFLPPPSKSLRWTGTIHLPRKCWQESDIERLRALPGVSVLCDHMCDEFSDIFDRSQMKVLPYGVDTSFFTPESTTNEARTKRLLFVGAWLRNTPMLARLVPEISRRFPDVSFDLVVPLFAREDRAFDPLRKHPSVRWYHNLSDEELRSRYQVSTAMLMPMEAGGANTAIVEALACGLPVITTDRGGIRSYGGGTVFPVVDNNDDSACLDLVAAYLTEPSFRSTISKNCRTFAETKLSWTIAAKEYIRTYSSLGMV